MSRTISVSSVDGHSPKRQPLPIPLFPKVKVSFSKLSLLTKSKTLLSSQPPRCSSQERAPLDFDLKWSLFKMFGKSYPTQKYQLVSTTQPHPPDRLGYGWFKYEIKSERVCIEITKPKYSDTLLFSFLFPHGFKLNLKVYIHTGYWEN